MANTYEIPVGSETKTIQANSKAEALANLRANGVTPTLNNSAPVVPKSSAIAVDTLGQQNTPLPTPPVIPTTGNLAMANNSTVGGIKADASYTPPVNTEKDQAKTALQGLIGKISGQADESNKIREDAKIYEKKQKALGISNELDDLDKKFREEVKTIRENTQGKFGGAIDQDVAKAQDRYENRRANISLAYKVALGDYQGAEEIVTNKINALKDQNTQALNAFQLYASFINNDLTDSGKIQLQEQIDLKKQKAQTVEDTYQSVLANAIQNNAPASILSAIDDASRSPGATAATIATAAGKYGVDVSKQLDETYKRAQISKLYSDLNPSGDQSTNDDLNAYASQYADTGKLPSPAELKLSGLNVGQVTSFAKQLPKPNGALVSTNTGTKSSALSPTEEQGITALSEIVRTTLPDLKDRFGKLVNRGLLGRAGAILYTSQDRQDYRTFRADFLAKLLVARSGGAVTEQEYERYSNLVPTEYGNAVLGGLSNAGDKTLNSLSSSMKSTLDNKLNTNQLSIYGYSKVKVNGVDRTVGEILDIGGAKYKVLPDGTLTDII